jgi:hypothetical protein
MSGPRIQVKFWFFPVALCLCGSSVFAADAKKPAKIPYEEHVLPLFRDKCVACHNQDKKRAGLVLDNYAKVMEGSSSGAVVKPGDAEGSPLFRVMAHKEEPFMPPKSPMLPKASLDLVENWIAGGALENAGSKAILANKPKVDIGLTSVVRGKPEGPPPMPPKTLRLEPIVRTKRGTAILALASSPWAPLIAVGGQKQVLLYHSDTLELLGVLPFPEGTPHVLKFSRNGSLLLAGGGHDGKSGRVVVWSVVKGERILSVGEESDAVLAADLSPDQTQIGGRAAERHRDGQRRRCGAEAGRVAAGRVEGGDNQGRHGSRLPRSDDRRCYRRGRRRREVEERSGLDAADAQVSDAVFDFLCFHPFGGTWGCVWLPRSPN